MYSGENTNEEHLSVVWQAFSIRLWSNLVSAEVCTWICRITDTLLPVTESTSHGSVWTAWDSNIHVDFPFESHSGRDSLGPCCDPTALGMANVPYVKFLPCSATTDHKRADWTFILIGNLGLSYRKYRMSSWVTVCPEWWPWLNAITHINNCYIIITIYKWLLNHYYSFCGVTKLIFSAVLHPIYHQSWHYWWN